MQVGEYTLANPDKVKRAQEAAGPGATDEQVLVEYDKLAGLITTLATVVETDEDGEETEKEIQEKVPNGRFYKSDKPSAPVAPKPKGTAKKVVKTVKKAKKSK